MAWTLDEALKRNMRYPNSCPEQIKLNILGMHTKAFIAGLIQRRYVDFVIKTYNRV
jgi:hypothetical protein